MTVKELIERLSQFPDNLIVMIPNIDWNCPWDVYENEPHDVPVTNVVNGFNEYDGCVFLGSYEEDE